MFLSVQTISPFKAGEYSFYFIPIEKIKSIICVPNREKKEVVMTIKMPISTTEEFGIEFGSVAVPDINSVIKRIMDERGCSFSENDMFMIPMGYKEKTSYLKHKNKTLDEIKKESNVDSSFGESFVFLKDVLMLTVDIVEGYDITTHTIITNNPKWRLSIIFKNTTKVKVMEYPGTESTNLPTLLNTLQQYAKQRFL